MRQLMMHLLFTLLIAGVFCARTTVTECRLSDIKSMIGGQDYTVDEMRGIHFIHETRDQLLVFGRFTTSEP